MEPNPKQTVSKAFVLTLAHWKRSDGEGRAMWNRKEEETFGSEGHRGSSLLSPSNNLENAIEFGHEKQNWTQNVEGAASSEQI